MCGCLMHVLNADFQALEDHLLLVAEIMIKRRLLRADGIGELVERSFMKAMVAKEARGGAQHLQPPCLAPDILADPGGRPILHRTHRTPLRSFPPGRHLQRAVWGKS